MDKVKYEECVDYGCHDFGYFEEAGVCLHCSLIHDCAKVWDFDYDNGYKCNVCHAYANEELVQEIEDENRDYSLLELDYKMRLEF